jgi:tRNA pseudouridine38-40 synthase
MVQRYFLELSYRGTRFHGWQRQPETVTVQQTINEALSTVFRESVECIGCGRTDTGVHARQFYAHFDAPAEVPEHLLHKLDALSGPDIVFKQLIPVHPDSHTRFHANRRKYVYHLHFGKDPFLQGLSYPYRLGPMVPEVMDEAAEILPRIKNFASFCKSNSGVNHTFCELYEAYWIRDRGKGRWEFHISANRFLRGMVRLIVGSLIDIGRGKIEPEDWEELIQQGERLPRVTSAPAEGLYLQEVHYPSEIFEGKAPPHFEKMALDEEAE